MGKKTIIIVLVGLALVSVRFAEAQQAKKVIKIGFLGTRPAAGSSGVRNSFESVRSILREFDYVEDKNIAFEYRRADNKLDYSPPWRMIWSASKLTCS